jgi:RNA polymerase-binding transcription factor DksA
MERRIQPRTNIEHERGRASAADVLGTGHPIDSKFRDHYEQLVEMREQLISRRGDLGHIDTVEEANHNINMAERGTEEYDVGAQFGQFSTDQNAIFEIDQALRRIADGTYGRCEATGKNIPEERLQAVPWTRFVSDVEEQIENEARMHRPHHIL